MMLGSVYHSVNEQSRLRILVHVTKNSTEKSNQPSLKKWTQRLNYIFKNVKNVNCFFLKNVLLVKCC